MPLLFSFYQYQKADQLNAVISGKNDQIKHFEKELSILRTLNPYHVNTDEIVVEAAQNVDLFPGWVARVYPVPDSRRKAKTVNDLGSFIMNETRFSLSSHTRYGITQPAKSMYKLNGLFPSYVEGRLQVGVEFYLTGNNRVEGKDAVSKLCSCYARIDINQKRVIDQKLHVVTRYNHEQVLTGEVELEKGLFPISATFYCDKKSDFQGDEVQVAISFRNPGQYNLTTKRNSVFHIYKPAAQGFARL